MSYLTDVTHWESKLYLSSISKGVLSEGPKDSFGESFGLDKAALNELNAIKYGLQLQLEF